jgi:hypothetical protein
MHRWEFGITAITLCKVGLSTRQLLCNNDFGTRQSVRIYYQFSCISMWTILDFNQAHILEVTYFPEFSHSALLITIIIILLLLLLLVVVVVVFIFEIGHHNAIKLHITYLWTKHLCKSVITSYIQQTCCTLQYTCLFPSKCSA